MSSPDTFASRSTTARPSSPQAFFKGGAEHPLSDEELRRKFRANCRYGGLSPDRPTRLRSGSTTSSTSASFSATSLRHGRLHRERTGTKRSCSRDWSRRNIARQIPLRLSDRVYAIAVNVRSSLDEGRAVVEEIIAGNGAALLCVADVTDEAAVGRMMSDIEQRWGRLDVLVNNAAVRQEVSLDQMSVEQWRTTLAVVLDGAFFCTRGVATFAQVRACKHRQYRRHDGSYRRRAARTS
jgi:hypothetical protein